MSHYYILASQSPRRQVLLKLLQIPHGIMVPNADEESIMDEEPSVNVVNTAILKAKTIARQLPSKKSAVIIAADTTVALDDKMLGKPKNKAEAKEMLLALRAKEHQVLTGLVLLNNASGQLFQDVSRSTVTMRSYTDEEINTYIASGDPMDKAGAYAIQHPTFRPVAKLDGCFTGVMGLSLCQLIMALDAWELPRLKDLTAVSSAHINHPCPLLDKLLIN